MKKQACDLTALHDRFLESYSAKYLNIGKSPQCWAEGPNDGYFFQHLARHLIEAGRKDELRTILLDFNWIRAKLKATDVSSLVADYDFLPEDSEAFLVRDALRLSAHVLATDKAQLAGQILGRMMAFPSPSIQTMLDQIGVNENEFWIRPLAPNLRPAGGPLLRTLKGHTGWVNAVAVTPDGRKAVSASGDQTLKVLDLERGEVIAAFTGDRPIICCAIGPEGVTIVAGDSLGRVHFLRLKNA